jgi:ribosome biogenesis GTPase
LIRGQVVAAHGRHFLVQTAQSGALNCITLGRKLDVVCGDQVVLKAIASDQGVIEKVLPRTSLFMRADAFRSKAIAANATQVAIVVAPKPSWSEDLLQRCLLAAGSQRLPALIVANKSDLPEHAATMDALFLYASLGYPVISLCAKKGVSELVERLHGHLTLLAGQSGMGKSTLINALFPDAEAKVEAFSAALDSGRHTTTHSRLYRLDENSAVIDSPGFQEFALAQLSRADIEAAMPEFRPYHGKCRFRDCRHHTEPGCAIQLAAEEGMISQHRLNFFRHILAENERQ